jgi:hypothetical protein
MDPYLEEPRLWPGVHLMLIAAFSEMLNKRLRPKYVADVEERIYLTPENDPTQEQQRVPDIWIEHRSSQASAETGPPENGTLALAEPLVVTTLLEEETHERRVEIRTTGDRKLVAVIELLSPANKTTGSAGRESFLAKRREVTSSLAHWVEIDLLREGIFSPFRRHLKPHEYFAHISPVELRSRGRIFPIRIQERLPVIGIPLGSPDADVPLDLQQALDLIYDRGAYDLKVDYTKAPIPPLPPSFAKWANKLLKQKKPH